MVIRIVVYACIQRLKNEEMCGTHDELKCIPAESYTYVNGMFNDRRINLLLWSMQPYTALRFACSVLQRKNVRNMHSQESLK